MMEHTFNFLDNVNVKISGEGEAFQNLIHNYSRLPNNPNANPDVICEITDFSAQPDITFGNRGRVFGRSDEQFVIRKIGTGGISSEILLNKDWDRIKCHPKTNHYLISNIIEFNIRNMLKDEGVGLVHASGVRYNGETYIFPAWRHTGKTNTMLGLILDGASYISDDRVWVSEDGEVYGYPLPINMLPYNYNSFPEFELNRSYAYRNYISNQISRFVSENGSFLAKAVGLFNRHYINPGGKKMYVDQMTNSTDYAGESNLNNLVILQTCPYEKSNVSVSEIKPEETLRILQAISHFEWNEEIQTFAKVHDMLFNDGMKKQVLNKLMSREKKIFAGMARNCAHYKIMLPQEDDWTKRGIRSGIISKIKEL